MRPTPAIMRCEVEQPGFTLVEMMLALALSSALIIAVISFYDSAVDSRTRVNEHVEFTAAQRHVMERVTEELRSALSYRFLRIGMEGNLTQMTFPSTRLPGPSIWAVKDASEKPVPPEHDLSIVGYRLRIVETEEGELIVVGLERTEQQLVNARVPEEGDEIDAKLLSSHIKFLRLRYWQDGAWVTQWSGGDLPLAVEVVMGSQPQLEVEEADLEEMELKDYPGQLFRRVIYLPGGSRPRQGSTVRGLGR